MNHSKPPIAGDWPTADLEAVTQCPFCGNRERTPLHRGLTDSLFHNAEGKWNQYQCQSCKAAYLDPRPTPESIGKAYATYFTHNDAAHSTPNSGLRRWLHTERNSWRNRHWHMALEPQSSWRGWWIPMVGPLRSLIVNQMRHLPQHLPRPGAHLLDVGCGSGDFLRLARAAGWTVQGVDFDPVAVQVAHRLDLDVRHGGLERAEPPPGGYDCITCSHVIEHVHDPVQWLRDMHALLRPNGTLWIQAPNIDSWGYHEFGADWHSLDAPRHLAIPTVAGLRSCLEALSFTVSVEKLTPILALSVYVASDTLRQGGDATAPQNWKKLLRPRYALAAIRQTWQPTHAEFITLVATKASA